MEDYVLAISKLSAAQAIALSETTYSNSIKFNKAVGYAAVLITITGSGSLTITQQCSLDNGTFYDPVNSANSALGAVAAAFTAGTRYIQFDPVITPYFRFKIVEGGTDTAVVTITLIFQE